MRISGRIFALSLVLVAGPRAGAAWAQAACPAFVPSVTIATGEGPGVVAGTDTNWQLVPGLTTFPAPADPPVVVAANSHWLTIPGTQWISASSSTTAPAATYAYQTCFCLRDGFARPQLQITARADNSEKILLNGALILTGQADSFGTPLPDQVTVTNPNSFRIGQNCLTVETTNSEASITAFDLRAVIAAAGPGATGSGVVTPACCKSPTPSCTLTGNLVSGCCLGQVPCPGSGGSPSFFDSFLASVTLGGAASCALTVTGSPATVNILSTAPATLVGGANFLSGTLSAPPNTPYSLNLSCTSGGTVLCSTTLSGTTPGACPQAPCPTCAATQLAPTP
jgi:hypothetical protein